MDYFVFSFQIFLIVWVRMLAMVMMAPLFSSRSIPIRLKGLFAFIVTMLIFPSVSKLGYERPVWHDAQTFWNIQGWVVSRNWVAYRRHLFISSVFVDNKGKTVQQRTSSTLKTVLIKKWENVKEISSFIHNLKKKKIPVETNWKNTGIFISVSRRTALGI